MHCRTRVRRDLEVASLFSSLFYLFHSIKMRQRKGEEETFWCWAKVLCVKPPPPWLGSAQINNGLVKVSAASTFTAEVLLGALPALASCHSHCPPLCPPGGQGTRYPRYHPSLGQAVGAQGPPWGLSLWRPGTGNCPEMCCSTSSALFSSCSPCCLEGTARESSA